MILPTDGQTDRWTSETSIPPLQLRWAEGTRISSKWQHFHFKITKCADHSTVRECKVTFKLSDIIDNSCDTKWWHCCITQFGQQEFGQLSWIHHNEAWTKWSTFCRQHFQMLFLIENGRIVIKIPPRLFLRVQLILCQHWFRQWHGTKQDTRLLFWGNYVNSSPPSATNMRQWTEPALIQVMSRRLFGAEPLPESVLTYCQLDPYEQTSVKLK